MVIHKIKDEIHRLLKAKFIRTARYVNWVSNIMLVMKKNGKLRVCIDCRNLNSATLKVEYPMPIADMLVDATVGHNILSFMHGYSRYNQIFITEEDLSKTTFHCPSALSTYQWVMMPFGLKNAKAIYQGAMNSIFHEFIGKFMEIYVEHVVVKLDTKQTHLKHLKRALDRMQKHNLKMNPLKCAFGVSTGNFLGFLVQKKRIEVDKNKTKAILEATPPANKKQLQTCLEKHKCLLL